MTGTATLVASSATRARTLSDFFAASSAFVIRAGGEAVRRRGGRGARGCDDDGQDEDALGRPEASRGLSERDRKTFFKKPNGFGPDGLTRGTGYSYHPFHSPSPV